MKLQKQLGMSQEWRAAWLCSLALVACGKATCPKGSIDQDGDCVAIDACADGEALEDGRCVDMRGVRGSDAGTPVIGTGDAAADDGSTLDPCSDLDCGAHGRCEPSGAGSVCTCDPGFAGKLCDACEAGLGLSSDGECVPPCEAAAAPDCGAHGTCEATEDTAGCTCERGFAGDTCSECAESFRASEDESGACIPDCGDCGAHARCDEAAEIPACVCVPGYRNDGEGCQWVGNGENGGGLVDGDLEDPNAWQTRHVTIDRGAARFVNAIVEGECEIGWLAQRFDMPRLEDAETLVLDLVVTTSCTSADPLQCPALLVETGSSLRRVQVPGGNGGARTIPLCLGEAGYGDAVDLRIRPSIASGAGTDTSPGFFDCENDSWPVIEAMNVRAASEDECPTRVGVQGGEFDEPTGWTVQFGVIAGGQLVVQAQGTATGQVAVPLAANMPAAALRFQNADLTRTGIVVSLDGLVWNTIVPEIGSAVSLCVPDWAQGAVHELQLKANNDATLEAIAIEPDPTCDDGGFDRGFEREVDGQGVGMHGSWASIGGYPIVRQAAAYTGSHGVRMTGAINGMRALARIPEATTTEGPAFAFVHRINDPAVVGTMEMRPFDVPVSELSSSHWTPSLFCLDRQWRGQLVTMAFVISLSGSTAGIDIDDVGPTLDETCD